MDSREATLRCQYPQINWDEPIAYTSVRYGEGWACRVCIALLGINGMEGPGGKWWREHDEAVRHINFHRVVR
jgi:hypothetical protein